MIELARHIEILLLDNDCVIVPGFGGFIAHPVSARFEKAENTFLPPYRTIGFNPKMTLNDGLLVQSYMLAYDANYPEAVKMVEAKVNELIALLEREGSFELHGIGTLYQNVEGNSTFVPFAAGILSPSLYGFSSFELKPLEVLKKEQTTPQIVETPMQTAQQEPTTKKPIVIHLNRTWVNNAVAAAVAVILFFVLSTPIEYNPAYNVSETQASFNQVFDKIQHQSLMVNLLDEAVKVKKEAVKPIAQKLQPTVKEVVEPKEEQKTMVQPETKETNQPYYTLVLASQVAKSNAECFVKELNEQHLTEAQVLTKGNTTRVVYARFETEQEAFSKLNELRSQKLFESAWVLKVK